MARMQEALEKIRREAANTTEMGTRFEVLVRDAFRTYSGEWGKDRFVWVELWRDWEGSKDFSGGGDFGIDLVALQTPAWGGGMCAIQAKLHQGNVTTRQVDKFLAAAPESKFDAAVLVTASDLDRNGMRKMENRQGGKVLYANEMDAWTKDWVKFIETPDSAIKPPKPLKPRPHQKEALAAIREGWKEHDRGQLILPCGTGKTLAALWAAEQTAEPGDTVLFLVPSLALMGQTMGEWSRHKSVPMQFLAVCSDADVGKGGKMSTRRLPELFADVTTSEDDIRKRLSEDIPPGHIRAVFCTYQSSPRLAAAAKHVEFALAVFDEAHRTTGVERDGGFQTAMKDENIACLRRLFMTATPRVFTETQHKKLNHDGEAYTMDSEELYGPVLYEMSFSKAIKNELLSDYTVHVVAVGEDALSAIGDRATFNWGDFVPDYKPRGPKDKYGNRTHALSFKEALQLAGAWDALSTPYSAGWEEGHVTGKMDAEEGEAASSALIYFNRIPRSEETAQVWGNLARHLAEKSSGRIDSFLKIGVSHMDGKTPAGERKRELDRLREAERGSGKCEVISNVRVLTEGVDVPGLDAVIFMDPRTSDIDITQAVGRAMRSSTGKKEGHIIIPVVVPPSDDPDQILDKSAYRSVAAVVRALRSNDERWTYWLSDATLTKGKLNPRKVDGKKDGKPNVEPLRLVLSKEVASKMVDLCGDKTMWPTWGKKAGGVAKTIIDKFRKAVDDSNEVSKTFSKLCDQMKEVCGHSTPKEVREMVAHHIAVIPIFDAMFDEKFSKDNPVSAGIQKVLSALEVEGVSFEAEQVALERSYRRMRQILEAADEAAKKGGNPFGKADVIRQIYDGFIAEGMTKKAKSLGVVYTPVWIVDFMLRSVDAVCRKHFGHGVDEGARFLEPFCGTGTFPQRLLTGKRDNGEFLVREENLERTWRNMFGSEILMLPYYAAAVGTEEAYRRRIWERDGTDAGYYPWERLTLQDSMLKTTGQWSLEGMGENVRRVSETAETDVDIICTNPPWSMGKKREADSEGKKGYPHVAERIRETYVPKLRQLGVKKGGTVSGNLYVHAFRWASDRLAEGNGKGKVLAMVHPNSLLEGGSLAGVRRCLEEEFTDIYTVNLRGNAKKRGESQKKEGDNAFEKTQSGVQITVAVQDPARKGKRARVRVAEVPFYLKRDAKKEWLEQLGDVTSPSGFRVVDENDEGRWVFPPDEMWGRLTALTGNEEMVGSRLNCQGIITGADHLFVSYSPTVLAERMEELLGEYGELLKIVQELGRKPTKEYIDNLTSSTPLSGSGNLREQLRMRKEIVFDPTHIIPILYRPFVQRFLYADPNVIHRYSVELRDWPAEREREREREQSFTQAGTGGLGGWSYPTSDPRFARPGPANRPEPPGSPGHNLHSPTHKWIGVRPGCPHQAGPPRLTPLGQNLHLIMYAYQSGEATIPATLLKSGLVAESRGSGSGMRPLPRTRLFQSTASSSGLVRRGTHRHRQSGLAVLASSIGNCRSTA